MPLRRTSQRAKTVNIIMYSLPPFFKKRKEKLLWRKNQMATVEGCVNDLSQWQFHHCHQG